MRAGKSPLWMPAQIVMRLPPRVSTMDWATPPPRSTTITGNQSLRGNLFPMQVAEATQTSPVLVLRTTSDHVASAGEARTSSPANNALKRRRNARMQKLSNKEAIRTSLYRGQRRRGWRLLGPAESVSIRAALTDAEQVALASQ